MAGIPSSTLPRMTKATMVTARNIGTPPGSAVIVLPSDAENPTLTINTTPAVLAATLAGAGLSVLPDFQVMEDIKAGRLTHILPAWSLPAGGIHAVYPAARFRPPKVTAFVAML